MQPNIPTEQPIKTLDGLESTHEKLTPQILEELKELLRQKYGIDMSKEIFHITREELDALKAELDGNVSPKTTLEKFLYDEYIETKLEQESLSAVSLDTVTSGIQSEKINELKKEFEDAIDPILNSYDFFPASVKNIIKLALANKCISSQSGENVMGLIGNLEKGLQSGSLEALTSLGKEATSGDIKGDFEKTIQSYVVIFNKIQDTFGSDKTLTQTQKQNIILASEYFTSPDKIEAGIDEKILEEIKIENKDTLTSKALSEAKQEELKKYLLKSRTNLDQVIEIMAGADDKLEMGLSLISQEGIVGDTSKDILSFFLKIPILGAILAMFFGLDSKDPIADLNEQSDLFKSLRNLKTLGVQKDKTGNREKNGDGELEGIDLSEIQYSQVKSSLKNISKLNGGTPSEKIWSEAFAKDGTQINEITFKLEISPEVKKDKKIDSKEFNEIIQKGLENYNKQVKEKEDTQLAEQRDKKAQETQVALQTAQENITTLSGKIALIDDILNKKYENIANFSNILGAAIDDIAIGTIKNHFQDNFESILKDTIGQDKYHTILEAHRQLLNSLFAYIREYSKEKNIETGTLKDFLKNSTHDFQAFVTTKKTVLIAEKESTTTTLAQSQKETQAAEARKKVQETLKSANGKNINEIDGFLFNSDTQEISIGNTNYKISGLLPGAKIEDINIGETHVNFKGRLGLIPRIVPIAKQEFISGVATLMETGKFQNDTITLTKIG